MGDAGDARVGEERMQMNERTSEYWYPDVVVEEEDHDAEVCSDAAAQVAIEYVANYLALKAQIATMEVRAAEERQAAIEALHVADEKPGKTWVYEGLGTVSIVTGRVTEKLDRAILARAGVDPALLDQATKQTRGDPSVRITAWTDKDRLAAKGWKAGDPDAS